MSYPRGPRTVYFIKPIGMDGPIKIGFSVSPDGRRKSLESWCPFPLEVIAETPGDGMVERGFHALLEPFWIGHEWFTASPEVMAVVAAVHAGSFDLGSLPAPKYLRKARSRGWTDQQRAYASFGATDRKIRKATGLVLTKEAEDQCLAIVNSGRPFAEIKAEVTAICSIPQNRQTWADRYNRKAA